MCDRSSDRTTSRRNLLRPQSAHRQLQHSPTPRPDTQYSKTKDKVTHIGTEKNQCISTAFELDHRLQAQNIYERVGKLLARYKTKTAYTQKMEDQAEILDDYITKCMLTAESTIHSHHLDDFSPTKVEAASVEKFWKLAFQANANGTPTPTPPMARIISKYPNMDTTGHQDIPSILEKLQESKETYKDAVAKGKELRHQFRLERAEIAANNSNQTLETAIKQLAHIEASIQTYSAIKQVMNPSAYRPGLTSIRVPTNEGPYRTVNDSREIEEHLIHRNRKHYAQAEHTAMANHLIHEKMGVSGTTDFCDQLLAGTADLPKLPATLKPYSNNYTDHTQ
jgi:hypothetical protein